MSELQCKRCNRKITRNDPAEKDGVIYIRDIVNQQWGNHPICTGCWNVENPNRIPHRIIWDQ